MGDYRPRRHDHLVEPLLGGLRSAHDSGRSGRSRALVGLILLVLAGALAVYWLR